MPSVGQGRKSLEQRIGIVLGIYFLILGSGVVGYHLIEGWSWIDSLYMTVITITTVGFSEVGQLDGAGRIFTIALIFLGVGGFMYTFGTIADYLIAGELSGLLGRRRLKRNLEQMNGHYLVCGFGRVGYQVAKEFSRAGKKVVIVEEKEEVAEQAENQNLIVLKGNANSDDVLKTAGVERAKGLVCTLGTDAANLMLVLSARALNPKLFIVARGNYEATEAKLKIAGADRVISPYSIGGHRMAQVAIRPNVVEFFDVMMHGEKLELMMEDLTISAQSLLDGSTIGTSRVREKTGANIIGLRRKGVEPIIMAPTPDTTLNAEDVLVALGTQDQLNSLKEMST